MNKLITILVLSAIGSCLLGYWDTGYALCVVAVFSIPIAMWLDLRKKVELPPVRHKPDYPVISPGTKAFDLHYRQGLPKEDAIGQSGDDW